MDDPSLGLVVLKPGTYVVTPTPTPTATNNDYTRLANALATLNDGNTLILSGTFNWTEANAAASWALGNDGIAGGLDDYCLYVTSSKNNVTITASTLGAADPGSRRSPGSTMKAYSGSTAATTRIGPSLTWRYSILIGPWSNERLRGYRRLQRNANPQ